MKCLICGREFEACGMCRAGDRHQYCINDDLCHECFMEQKEKGNLGKSPKLRTPPGKHKLAGSVPDVIGNARKRGALDFVAGVVVGDNPYAEQDARHWDWMEGWAGAGLAAH